MLTKLHLRKHMLHHCLPTSSGIKGIVLCRTCFATQSAVLLLTVRNWENQQYLGCLHNAGHILKWANGHCRWIFSRFRPLLFHCCIVVQRISQTRHFFCHSFYVLRPLWAAKFHPCVCKRPHHLTCLSSWIPGSPFCQHFGIRIYYILLQIVDERGGTGA